MDRSQIGILICCGVIFIPLVVGSLLGAWFQRRLNTLGTPGAFLPGFIRKFLEEK